MNLEKFVGLIFVILMGLIICILRPWVARLGGGVAQGVDEFLPDAPNVVDVEALPVGILAEHAGQRLVVHADELESLPLELVGGVLRVLCPAGPRGCGGDETGSVSASDDADRAWESFARISSRQRLRGWVRGTTRDAPGPMESRWKLPSRMAGKKKSRRIARRRETHHSSASFLRVGDLLYMCSTRSMTARP